MGATWGLVGLGAAALGLALVLGGREERIFAGVKAVSALGAALAPLHTPTQTVVRDTWINVVLLAVVLPLAMRTLKAWPLAAASLCLAALMTAAAQMLVHAAPEAYGLLQGCWSLLAALVVALGAWNARRGRRPPEGS